MVDITTTNKFPFARVGIDATYTITSNAYATVGTTETGKFEIRMQENNLPSGDYELAISGIVTSDNLLNVPTGRLSINGGTSWDEFTVKAESTTIGKTFGYTLPMIGYSGANTDFVLQFKKSLADADAMTLLTCDLTVKRVG